MSQWRPSASIDALRARANLLGQIRSFFANKQVLEVDTPSLSRHSVTDPYLNALSTLHTQPGSSKRVPLFLQTSPEFAMKRLLASGSGDIFQICKAFRDDEVGRQHNPEFTILEWYRTGFSMQDLIDETAELLIRVLNAYTQTCTTVEQYTYAELFERYCNFNPLYVSPKELLKQLEVFGLQDYSASVLSVIDSEVDHSQISEGKRQQIHSDAMLQVLFNQYIETQIGQHRPAIVTHFPASQASLATLADDGLTANRFEVYFKGVELANGFNELKDPELQLARFEIDNQKRLALGLPIVPIDTNFIDALRAGLPKCSGIALGVDRLFMLALNKQEIREVLSFDYTNC